MPIQTVQSALVPAITFTYDDIDGDITEISINTTDASITKDWAGKGNLAGNDEAVLVTLVEELYEQFKNKLTSLDVPIHSDVADEFFDAQGITERDSGTTDVNGNPITETQLFKVLKLVTFYTFNPDVVFNSNNAVNDDD